MNPQKQQLIYKFLSLRIMDIHLSFKDYLTGKKIDSERFKSGEPRRYSELEKVFNQVNPNSFTAQKLFLINPIRIKYLLKEDNQISEEKVKTKPKLKLRPKIKR